MSSLITTVTHLPAAPPPLGLLLGGFALLVVGLAWLSRTRPQDLSLSSRRASGRALWYAVLYALTSAFFARLINPALQGQERSPWLLALCDVLFIALGLFAWFLVLVEDLPPRALGLHAGSGLRAAWTWTLCVTFGVVASLPHYLRLLSGQVPFSLDAMAFGALFAAGAASVPQELIFRGYLQGSLEGRMQRVPRVLIQALLYAGLHLGRILPGVDMSWSEFLVQVVGLLLPAGIFWGAMREWSGGSLLPVMVSHFLLRFGEAWVRTAPSG